MRTNDKMSQSTVAVNSASKCIVNALEKSLKKINKVENSDNPMFTGWVRVKEDVRIAVWAGRCYDAETQTYAFSGTFTMESKNHKGEYTTDVDCLVGVTSTERMTDDQCINYVIEEFIKKLDSLMTNYNSGPFSRIGHNAYILKYCYFGGAKNESPCLEDTPTLEDDDIITDTGLSVAGLKYVEEQLKDMSEDSFQMMVDDAMTELLEDKYTMDRIYFENYGVKHFVQEELVENLWVNLWFNLMGVTDEALEYETREYLKYDEYMDDLLESGAWVMCSNGMGAVHFNEDLACGAEDDSRLMELVGEYIAKKEIESIIRELDDESGAYKFEWDFFSSFFMNRMLGNGNYEWYVKEELKKCTDIADVRVYDDCLYIWATEPKNVNKWDVKTVA